MLGAAACSVGTQYVLKLLVDAMAGPRAIQSPVAACMALFLAAVAGGNLFRRLLGWRVCRVTLRIGVEVRLELFHGLGGQPTQLERRRF